MNTNGFHDLLIENLPRLRALSVAITRDRAKADDLLQEAVAKALAASDKFTPGTQFCAWMYRIMRNQFLSDIRRTRPTAELDDVNTAHLAASGSQEDNLVVGELKNGLDKLPAAQREALLLVALHDMSYEEVAEACDCSVGTIKSRVSRARQALRDYLMGEEAEEMPVAAEAAKSSMRVPTKERGGLTESVGSAHLIRARQDSVQSARHYNA
jgi:RNA polymerase sigma-70 factor (ECF subfamily)